MITYKDVTLKAEWMGHPKGSRIKLNSFTADLLTNRGSAKEEDVKDKEVKEPKRDKMIRAPKISKSL